MHLTGDTLAATSTTAIAGENLCKNRHRTFLRILDGDHLQILDQDQISARAVVLLPFSIRWRRSRGSGGRRE